MTVTEYIAAQPKAVQPVLRRVRAIIRKVMPKAEESIGYGIPTYKLDDRGVIYFAAWREHLSIYPASGLPKALVAKYKVSKGTIRFSFSEPLPVKLIERIAKLRAKSTSRLP